MIVGDRIYHHELVISHPGLNTISNHYTLENSRRTKELFTVLGSISMLQCPRFGR